MPLGAGRKPRQARDILAFTIMTTIERPVISMSSPHVSRFSPSGRSIRYLPWLLLFLAVLSVVGFRHLLLYRVAEWFVVSHPLEKADILYLLNGEHATRPFVAADLYRRGFASKVWIAQTEKDPTEMLGLYPNDTDVNKGVLIRCGVPEDRIVVVPYPNGVSSTWEETLAIRGFIDRHPVESILVVTSSLHTRRTEWAFRKIFADTSIHIRIAEAPHWGFDLTNWWRTERGTLTMVSEAVKMMYYLFNHRKQEA